jgi:hypothetical protein
MQENESPTVDQPERPDPTRSEMHDALGAYLLDALPDDERVSFERHLEECEVCQTELVELRPVVGILPTLFDREPDLMTLTRRGTLMTPSASIREAVIAAVPVDAPPEAVMTPEAQSATDEAEISAPVEQPAADEGATPAEDAGPDTTVPDEPAAAAEPALEERTGEETATAAEPTTDQSLAPAEAPAAIPVTTAEPEEGAMAEPGTAASPADAAAGATVDPALRPRPKGRIAPGVQTEPAPIAARARRSSLPWVIAILSLLIAAGGILWALAMLNRVGDLEDEIAFQNQQIEALEAERDNLLAQNVAVAYTLMPTTIGSPDASGTIYAAAETDNSVMTVSGLELLPEDRAYKVWYLVDGGPQQGPLFDVGDDGSGLAALAPEVGTYDAVLVTNEPADDSSEQPTSEPVLQWENPSPVA